VKKEPTRIAELVQDPECGVYVVKDKALVARIDGKDVHFCSERCRDKRSEEHTSELSH
jgi:YHS domain-containing protein